jgi:hypothetical protein
MKIVLDTNILVSGRSASAKCWPSLTLMVWPLMPAEYQTWICPTRMIEPFLAVRAGGLGGFSGDREFVRLPAEQASRLRGCFSRSVHGTLAEVAARGLSWFNCFD